MSESLSLRLSRMLATYEAKAISHWEEWKVDRKNETALRKLATALRLCHKTQQLIKKHGPTDPNL